MSKLLFVVSILLTLLVSVQPFSDAQAAQEAHGRPQSPRKAEAVAVDTNELEEFPYDAGKVKFIATSEQTAGAYAVVELTEMPGYKTAWHRHNNYEETFYVMEGVLTITIANETHELPAGSYILIPRGTPHAQGNFSAHPVRLLTTFTPGGFDRFFADRVELFKTVKPGEVGFQTRFDGLRAKNRHWVEILGDWTIQK